MRAHPRGWSERTHYRGGQCGQSCPCCRFAVESALNADPSAWFGVCPVCAAMREKRGDARKARKIKRKPRRSARAQTTRL